MSAQKDGKEFQPTITATNIYWLGDYLNLVMSQKGMTSILAES